MRLFHIVLDFVRRAKLVVSLFKLKAALKIALHINIGRKGKAVGFKAL